MSRPAIPVAASTHDPVPIGKVRTALTRWGLDRAEVEPLLGGEQKTLWKVRDDDATYVLRLYGHSVMPEHVLQELALTSVLRASVREVAESHLTVDGEPIAVVDGRVAALTAFVEGERPQRTDTSRSATAGVLARIHVAGSRHAPSTSSLFPPLAEFDWVSNRWWDMDAITSGRLHPLVDLAVSRVATVPHILEQLTGLPTAIVHNDFHLGNLVASPDGTIRAVIDWDWATVDWRVLDVASGLRSFVLFGGGGGDDIAAALAFLDAYDTTATVALSEAERRAIPSVLRLRATWAALYDLGRQHIDAIDDDGIDCRIRDLESTDRFASSLTAAT